MMGRESTAAGRKFAVLAAVASLTACGGTTQNPGLMAQSPSPAAERTFRHHDPIHDVFEFIADQQGTRAPANATADVRTATFTRSDTRVVATIKLRRYGGGTWYWTEFIKTARASYDIEASKLPGRPVRLTVSHREQLPFPCPGLRAKIRPALNMVQVSVPTGCVHDPQKIRVALTYSVRGHGGLATYYRDDSLRRGFATPETTPVGLTPTL